MTTATKTAYKSDEHALKHLEILQGIVTRMANNSFLIKGWSVTISSALFALSAKDADGSYAFLAIFPALAFWFMDANYLRLERVFRHKYESAAVDRGMSISQEQPSTSYGSAFVAFATWPFYVPSIAVATLIGSRFVHFGH